MDSFGELDRRHYVVVVGVACCVPADRHLAEDAAQEAFVIACRELAGLRRAERFAPWICTIARRVAVRMARKGGYWSAEPAAGKPPARSDPREAETEQSGDDWDFDGRTLIRNMSKSTQVAVNICGLIQRCESGGKP